MDIFVLRPLITAILEYCMAYWVFKKGRFLPKLAAITLVFLASYQLGEFILFATDYDKFAVNFSFFSTTLLPPMGVLLLQKLAQRNVGYILFQILGLFFAFTVIFYPDIVVSTEECYCFAKYATNLVGWNQLFMDMWALYYAAGLIYGMTMSGIMYFIKTFKPKREHLKHLFITYALFFPTSYFIVRLFNIDTGYLPSIMCALAILGAIAITRMSLKLKPFPPKG